MAKSREISVYLSTNTILALCDSPPELRNSKINVLVSKRRTLLRWKVVNLVPLMPDEDKTFRGSLGPAYMNRAGPVSRCQFAGISARLLNVVKINFAIT